MSFANVKIKIRDDGMVEDLLLNGMSIASSINSLAIYFEPNRPYATLAFKLAAHVDMSPEEFVADVTTTKTHSKTKA